MTAKSATERKREERARKKMSEEERLARLLARTIKLDLYKSTDMALIRCMARAFMTEARSRRHLPAQREFVAWLVQKARYRHHRHINQRRAIRTGQLELFA